MSNVGNDVISRLTQLSTARTDFEWSWRQVAKVAAPDVEFETYSFGSGGSFLLPSATASRRSKQIYDETAVWAVERLASGLEALIVPQSEYWHSVDIVSLSDVEASHEEQIWFERVRNLMFKVRYDADSGWLSTIQTALHRLIQFGNAFIWVEEGDTKKALVEYTHIPLQQCYASENAKGRINGFYRYYSLTAEQAAQQFPLDKLPPRIVQYANDPRNKDQRFRFIHAVHERGEVGSRAEGVMKAPWASVHVELESRTVVKESGYFTFPVVDLRWLPEQGKVYGEGPVMRVLSSIQSLNVLARNELIASDQAIKPPLMTANSGVLIKPSWKPGSITTGAISPTGQKLVAPLFDGQRLDFATLVLEAKRNAVKEALYVNLFALLVQNPQMSATEAMIRANEKGELLGPAGARIQQSLSGLVERELDILDRKGLYAEGSAYLPPESLENVDIGPQFSGPINRLRQVKEAEGTLRTLEVMSPLAGIDPDVADNFDGDEMARGLAQIFGAPMRFIRTPEKVQERRAQRQQAQQAQQAAETAKVMAEAGAQGTQALQGLQQLGL